MKRADVLARVGNRVITVDDFEREAKRRGSSGYYDTLEGRRALLDDMVQLEQLAVRAEQLGYAEDPGIERERTYLLAGALKSERIDGELAAVAVSDQEVEAYYHQNSERYTAPEAAHAAVIFFELPAGAAESYREQTRAGAEGVRAEALTQDPTQHFGALAARHSSDQATRYRGGDIGWLAKGDDGSRWEPALRDAVFALAQPGEMPPLLTTERGIYLIRLLDKTPPQPRPLDKVRDEIRARLLREKRAERRKAIVAELTDGVRIEIDEQRLADFRPVRPYLAEQPSAPPPLPQG